MRYPFLPPSPRSMLQLPADALYVPGRITRNLDVFAYAANDVGAQTHEHTISQANAVNDARAAAHVAVLTDYRSA